MSARQEEYRGNWQRDRAALHGEAAIVPPCSVVLLLKPTEVNCLTGVSVHWVHSPTFTSVDLSSLGLGKTIADQFASAL